jgi:hypothetical protein
VPLAFDLIPLLLVQFKILMVIFQFFPMTRIPLVSILTSPIQIQPKILMETFLFFLLLWAILPMVFILIPLHQALFQELLLFILTWRIAEIE